MRQGAQKFRFTHPIKGETIVTIPSGGSEQHDFETMSTHAWIAIAMIAFVLAVILESDGER